MTVQSRIARWLIAGLMAPLMMAVAACGEADPAADGLMVLKRGTEDEIQSMDPQRVTGATDSKIMRDLYWGLTEYSADGLVIPAAAYRWEVSADRLTYVFHLHAGMTWSDGVALTADDFVYSLRRAVDPRSSAAFASMLYLIKGGRAVNAGERPPEDFAVRALDPLTLQIELTEALPAFPEIMAQAVALPVPRHAIEAHGKKWVKPGNLVVNGPFVLTDWVLQGGLTLDRNPRFHEARTVALDRVIYVPLQDSAAGVRRYRAGDVDMVAKFPSIQYRALKERLGDEVHVAPYAGSYYYVFNTRIAPFDDRRVREALSLAVDRDVIVDRIMGIRFPVAYAMVPPGLGGYEPASPMMFEAMPLVDRRARALALLSQAGFGPEAPLRFTLTYNTDDDHRKIAVAMQHMWADIGVRAVLENVEAVVLFQKLRQADFQVARSGWIADYSSPETFLFLLDSDTRPLNYSGYDNPAYDRLLRSAYQEADPARRLAVLAQAEHLAMQDHPLLSIYFYATKALVAPHVRGFVENVMDQHPSRFMHVVR